MKTEEQKQRSRAASQRWRDSHPEAARASRNESMRRWNAANPQKRKERGRATALKMRYGITVRQYEQPLAKQNGACAMCRRAPSSRLHVDHYHATGVVRALLCLKCNTTVGILEKRAEYLKMAAEYLGGFCR